MHAYPLMICSLNLALFRFFISFSINHLTKVLYFKKIMVLSPKGKNVRSFFCEMQSQILSLLKFLCLCSGETVKECDFFVPKILHFT